MSDSGNDRASSRRVIRGSAAALVRHMEDSLGVPTATTQRTFPVTALDRVREHLAGNGAAPLPSCIIAYAVVRAAMRVRSVTRRFERTEAGPACIDDAAVHLGIAVDVHRGNGRRQVVVPVMTSADSMDFPTFAAAYARVIDGARAGSLSADRMSGANLIVTNTGAFRSTTGIPRLPAGPGAIVAIGAVGYPIGFETIAANLGVSRVCSASCTYDHRVIQGGDSGEFLNELARLLGSAESEIFELLGAGRSSAAVTANEGGGLDAASWAYSVVDRFRRVGHSAASLNPLKTAVDRSAELLPSETPAAARAVSSSDVGLFVAQTRFVDALPLLEKAYCGRLGLEVEHLADPEERSWWHHRVESEVQQRRLPVKRRVEVLKQLIAIDALETFMQRAYPGEKTLSVQGLDITVLMAREAVQIAAAQGFSVVNIGMAHRGRLNLLAHVLNCRYERLFREFEASVDASALGSSVFNGDVKQHLGRTAILTVLDGVPPLTVELIPNPSHLEFVSPVTLGATRASQDIVERRRADSEQGPQSSATASRGATALPVLLHGDASFTGQGVVAETLNLRGLIGFDVGGTAHIVQDNQLGFTTEGPELRSTSWPSDIAKGYDVPIVHLNADYPETCLYAVQVALDYRRRYAKDVVLHVVGYRRLGHSETDEPTFTQPTMYAAINNHPPVSTIYAATLAEEGTVDKAFAERVREDVDHDLHQAHKSAKEPWHPEVAEPRPSTPAPCAPQTISAADLQLLSAELMDLPKDFAIHPKVARTLRRRRAALERGVVDWPHAETLALALVAASGTPVRFTGQDVTRGAFTQRHLTMWPTNGEPSFSPLVSVPSTHGLIQVFNSPLSEAAVVGFEYGYSLGRPEALTIWEAQFGDFANGAQVFMDQFLSGGYAKWGKHNRLVVLLPHGYEGSGPEHSSARLERYLQLAAEENIRVAVPSTPAQYFHLLRDQAVMPDPSPLVVLTPKSLLRHKSAVSAVQDIAGGGFAPVVLSDPPSDPTTVRRALLCTGKIYYELSERVAKGGRQDLVVVRLELLYPFPGAQLGTTLRRFRSLEGLTWVQEEPENMGAARYIARKLAASDSPPLAYAGRPARAAVAEGYAVDHRRAQARVMETALSTP